MRHVKRFAKGLFYNIKGDADRYHAAAVPYPHDTHTCLEVLRQHVAMPGIEYVISMGCAISQFWFDEKSGSSTISSCSDVSQTACLRLHLAEFAGQACPDVQLLGNHIAGLAVLCVLVPQGLPSTQ